MVPPLGDPHMCISTVSLSEHVSLPWQAILATPGVEIFHLRQDTPVFSIYIQDILPVFYFYTLTVGRSYTMQILHIHGISLPLAHFKIYKKPTTLKIQHYI